MTPRLAEDLAGQLRQHLTLARTLPVDVEGLARQLGVTQILRVSRLVEDGRLEQTNGHTRVLLASEASIERQRYTLAHEIGHLLLTDPERDTIARRMESDDEIERFCDAFAASLLLPRELVHSEYRSRKRKLNTVRHLGHRTGTSLAAATVRLNEVAHWRRALLHWKRAEQGWRYRWGAAIPVTLHQRLRSAPNTSATLDRLRSRGGNDQRTLISLRVGRTTMELPCEVSVRGRSAVALVEFGKHVPRH
ncbi:MAG: ImmA/IrrE family metallo-endopeptidase [Acidimicrobiia bacterium]